jgi:hypothetical protein
VFKELPERIRNLPSLQTLTLHRCSIPGVPAEALSQDYNDNCLGAVRAHYRDLEAGSATLTDVKVIVLGNGRVGKTQICRRLRGEDYDGNEPSTHGILVTSADLASSDAPVRLNIWDFGGQDLYHGTHALFLRTSAVFLLVWAKETENAREHEYQGVAFRNQPLTYWLAYVRHLAGTSRTLPDSVRGTALIWRISLGTWRGEQSSRTRRRISAVSSSSSCTPSRRTTNKGIQPSVPALGRSTTSASTTSGTSSTAR